MKQALEALKRERQKKGISQEDMADRIEKSRSTYVRMETGQGKMFTDTLLDTCKELELVPYVYLLPKEREYPDVESMLQRNGELEAEVEELKEKIAQLDRELTLLRKLEKAWERNEERG